LAPSNNLAILQMTQDKSSQKNTSPHSDTAVKMCVECTEAKVPGIPLSGGQADAESGNEPRGNGVSIVIVKRDDNALVENGSQFPHLCCENALSSRHDDELLLCANRKSICIPLGSCTQSRVSVYPGTCRSTGCCNYKFQSRWHLDEATVPLHCLGGIESLKAKKLHCFYGGLISHCVTPYYMSKTKNADRMCVSTLFDILLCFHNVERCKVIHILTGM